MFTRRGFALVSGSMLGAVGISFFVGSDRSSAKQNQQQPQQHRQGLVFTFGSNEFGQLGVDTPGQASAVPHRVEGQLRNRDVRQVAAGDDHVLALDAEGALFSWGRSQYQTLGYESDTVVNTPVRVAALSGVPVAQIAASSTNSYAVDVDGRLWSWGRSKALGRSLGDFGWGSGEAAAKGSWLPQPLPMLQGVQQVAAGHGFALALTRAGEVFSWGDNSRGALGLGGRDDHEVPTPVVQLNAGSSSDPIRRLSAGSQFALLLSQAGRVWFFGGNDYGQAGNMTRRYQRDPILVQGLGGPGGGQADSEQVADIAAGRSHCAAVNQTGQVWCWGLGTEGQIGVGTRQAHNPTPVALPEADFGGRRVVKVACGGMHTAAVTDDGRLYCWGRGRESQLGQADSLTSVAAAALVPHEVTWFQKNGYRVLDVALGNSFTCVLAEADPDAAARL